MSILGTALAMPRVGPDGSLSAPIAIVGEAPGADEVRSGKPFTGASGSVLLKMLLAVGLSRSDCYITNVVKEHPPGNNIDPFIQFNQRKGPQTSPVFDNYVKELKAELEHSKANVIVAVGNVALYALCGLTSVTKWRGSVIESTLLPGRKVIPIIHPASALRQYVYQHFIQFDLKRVKEECSFPEIRRTIREYVLEPSFNQVMEFLTHIEQNYSRTGCDIEVSHEELNCISFTHGPTKAISIPFYADGRDYFDIDTEGRVMCKIAAILENPNICKVFQNGVFDITFLFIKYGIRTVNIEDTMIGQAVMYPDFPKGLDFIASIYTREPYYKDDGKKWFRFGGSMHDFWLYNAKDSVIVDESIDKILGDLERMGNYDTYRKQTDLIIPLVEMQARGIKVDLDARAEASRRDTLKIAELEDQLASVVGFKINHASPKQLLDYFYGRLGHKPYLNKVTRKPTTDDMALKRLARNGVEAAQIIRDIRTLTKRKSTYLEMNLDKDGRIRCSFNPVGTGSLRLSSSKTIFDTGGNMQNLPVEIRQFIVADEGYIPYQIDLSQAENRVVAYVSPEPAMIDAFETGKDIHRRTAGLIFGKPEDEISDEEGSSVIGGGQFSERFWGKKANHGLNYDLGYKSFALYYEIPESEAKFIVERYHTAYPGVRQGHAWMRAQLAKDRTLTNCFGWKRLFLDRWGDQLFKEAYSFIPQSSVARQLNQFGIIEPYYGLRGPFEYVNQVHDSIWFQIPISAGWEEHARIVLALKHSLETPMKWRYTQFKIPADVECGAQNWGKFSDHNLGGLRKVKINADTTVEELARRLHGIYTEFGASHNLPQVGGN